MIEPLAAGPGNWVGACGVVYDTESSEYYLYYRIREPRPVRGGRCRLARSADGLNFETIWESSKADYETASIERGGLMRRADGGWRLYISYVDPADDRWRVDLIDAERPDAFHPGDRREVLTAATIGAEGVKDPFPFEYEGKVYLLLSYATTLDGLSSEQKEAMHASADIYNTGLTKSSSGLAVSEDGGVSFRWLGDIFSPSESGWDRYAARLSAIAYRAPVFVGFYDGSASFEENYEERLGVATSVDLTQWQRLTPDAPLIQGPGSTGSIRYVDFVDFPDHTALYYEMTRPDGSHEIRRNLIKR